MPPSREATPPSEASSCSFAPLATSTAFVQALQRDVHILIDAFALTWLWLDQHVDAPTSLRWEYGALAVFQRVWARNQWPQVSGLLGSDVRTRRAFIQAVADAFLDRIAAVTGPETAEPQTVLHAVGALLGLYFWWHAQPEGAWPAIRVDPAAYTAIASLPELARSELDTAPDASSSLPPSADVWYVVQQMLGTSSVPGYVHLYMEPRHVPRLRALTTVMPRKQLEACPRLVGHIGATQAPQPAPPAEASSVHEDMWRDLGMPSEGQATATSTRTAQSLEALQQAQKEYARAQKSAEDAVAWDSSSWEEGQPLSLPTILAYLQGAGPAS